MKIAPGMRMTLSKSSLSLSGDIPGARISKSTSGRTYRSVGVPGSGLYHVKSTTGSSSSSRQAPAPPAAPRPVKPGMLAPKAEKELYRAIQVGTGEAYEPVIQEHSCPAAAMLAGLIYTSEGNSERALALLLWALAKDDVENHPMVKKYLRGDRRLEIAPRVGGRTYRSA